MNQPLHATPILSNSLNHFALNTAGHDYVVGDIHGCFGKLQVHLAGLGFDSEKDRLFSVGDLVDRGPDSEAALEWLAKPWFHAIRGNHEQMAIDTLEGFYEPANYAFNGGQWFMDLAPERKQLFVDAFKKLPLWMEIETNEGLVGLVHGDGPSDWKYIHKLHEHHLLWGRMRITRKDPTPVKNIHHIYCGHTPLKEPTTYGNTTFIDTGAVFGKEFIIVKLP